VKPKVKSVTLTYFRKGRCEREQCTSKHSVERTKSFTASSDFEAARQAEHWMTTPLMHKRCEELG
jgi:hypothetical protein